MNEHKFKIGDTVRCVDKVCLNTGYHSGCWTLGDILIVDKMDEYNGNNYVCSEKGTKFSGGVYEDELELVTKRTKQNLNQL